MVSICNICGGPLCSRFLIKRSTIPDDADDFDDFWDDDCACPFRDQPPDENDREHPELKRLRPNPHHVSCPARRGYNYALLSHEQTRWLDNLRLIFKTSGGSGRTPGPCAISPPGRYNAAAPHFQAGVPEGSPEEFIDYGDVTGFIFHDSCIKILEIVQNYLISPERPVDLQEVFFTLQSLRGSDDAELPSPSIKFGGTELFAAADGWRPYSGFEWLVADPINYLDTAGIVEESSIDTTMHDDFFALNLPMSIIKRSRSKPPPPPDCFSRIPIEILVSILDLLPSPSAFNILLVSTTFQNVANMVPRSFWKARLWWGTRWMVGTNLDEDLHRWSTTVQYRGLLSCINTYFTLPWDDLNALKPSDFPSGLGPDLYIGMMNRRRIWDNCNRLLRNVERRYAKIRKEAGNVSNGIKRLAFRRVASISPTNDRRGERLSNVYFVPGLDRRGQLKAVAVYFWPQHWIIGIEFWLHGESEGRLFGHKNKFCDKVEIEDGATIMGISLSLGPIDPRTWDYDVDDSAIWGIGLHTRESYAEPKYRLGIWLDFNLMQVFHAEHGDEVVGIAGQFNVHTKRISKFGVIMADLKTQNLGEPVDGVDFTYHTRWAGRSPPPDYIVGRRIGTDVPDTSGDIDDAPQLSTPVYFLNLASRPQIHGIEVQFTKEDPWGPTIICGIAIVFTDRTGELIGYWHGMTEEELFASKSDDIPSPLVEDKPVRFDFIQAEQERIVRVRFHYQVDMFRFGLSGLQGIEFITSSGRTLSAGYNATEDDDSGETMTCPDRSSSLELVGLQFGLKPCRIEGAGAIYK